MRRRPRRGLVALAAAALVGAAACRGARVSDTGYVGTWSIGNERTRSVLAIVKSGDGYRVRPGVRTVDGSREVRCGWEGRCEEILDGASAFEWSLAARVDPGTGRLVVEIDARALAPGRVGFRIVDEFVVGPSGTALEAYTLERSGQVFAAGARPRRVYEKVSDQVEEAPP